MADKLPPISQLDLTALTQSEEGVPSVRTEKLNDELRDTSAFRELKKKAEKEQWSRERLDEAVRALGIR